MKQKLTLFCYLLITAVLLPRTMNAQFLNYLPGESNYIRGDVKNEAGGLTFTYNLQDESTLALKTIILRTNNNGQVQWAKERGSSFISYTMAPDSSVIITGNATNAGANRIAILQKQDKDGNIIWSKSLSTSSADAGIGNIMIGENNMIFATITRGSFTSSTYYSRAAVVAYDKDGQLLWIKHYGNATLTTGYAFSRTMLAKNGDFIGVAYVRGSSASSTIGMMITRINSQGTIIFSKYIDFKPTNNYLSVTGLVETASGNIVFGGRLMVDGISTYPNTMWLGLMDAAGNMIQQKVYSGGKDVGEQLHGLGYANGKIYAYLYFYSPYSEGVNQSNWIGTIDETSLAFTAQNATKLVVNPEDPYGSVNNSFCITSDGKPTIAAGFYCVEKGKYFSLMQQWSSNLASSCATLDAVQPLVDTEANYVVTNYTPTGSFTVTYANNANVIVLTNAPSVVTADLCNGCATPTTSVKQPQEREMFRIYPNPGNGHYFIDMEQPFQDAQIAIYNNLGAIVYESKLQGTHQSIDLSEQSFGIYFVKVLTNEGRVTTSKLIKSR